MFNPDTNRRQYLLAGKAANSVLALALGLCRRLLSSRGVRQARLALGLATSLPQNQRFGAGLWFGGGKAGGSLLTNKGFLLAAGAGLADFYKFYARQAGSFLHSLGGFFQQSLPSVLAGFYPLYTGAITTITNFEKGGM